MTPTIKCLSCGAVLTEAVGPCWLCGGPIELRVGLSGVGCNVAVGQVGTVNDTSTIERGRQISHTAPTGSQSDASLIGNHIRIRVQRPVDVGTRGEQRVLACITAFLTMECNPPTLLHADDRVGEDRVLRINTAIVTLQIVAATPDESFWHSVSKGAAETRVELLEAAGWIDATICKKAGKYSAELRSTMLLAVDVGHMGVLADSAFDKIYLDAYGDPATRHGFGGVWLVGPTESHVLRLGTSRW
jgi:hypothetical protein